MSSSTVRGWLRAENGFDIDWAKVRDEFDLDRNYAHLSQFYMTSHPRTVRDSIARHREAIDANPFLAVERGLFGRPDEQPVSAVYDAAARYTGGRREQIALVPNTTTGLALVYHGLPLKSGDEVLTTTHDHFTQHEAIRLATSRVGATTRRIVLVDDPTAPDEAEIVRRMCAAIRPETRALGLTWVHSSTGLKLPIAAITKAVADLNEYRLAPDRILVIVDGTHGLGSTAERVADLGADFFVASTHKWLFAPRGTGIIHGPEASWARIQPTVATYSSWDLFEAWKDDAPPGPTRADHISPGGFIAYEHQWAMKEAFDFHIAIGRRRIARRISELNGRLKRGLAALDGVTVRTPMADRWSAGIVSFDVEGVAPEVVVRELLAASVVASTTPYRKPSARLSAGIMNDEREVDRAIAGVRAIASNARIGDAGLIAS